MSNSINTQHMKLISGYINSENNPAPGVPLSSPSGSIVQSYGGMVGGRMYVDTATALAQSNPAVGTLYAGVYQMVLFKSGETFKRGQIVFWDVTVAAGNFQVTGLAASVSPGNLKAGVVVNADAGSTGNITGGNYGFIQIAGRASILFRAVLSSAGAVGSLVWLGAGGTAADNSQGDVLDPTFAMDIGDISHYLGTAETAPANATISVVDLAPFGLRQ